MTAEQWKFIKFIISVFLTIVILSNPVSKTFIIPVIFAGIYKLFSLIPNN